MANIDIKSGLYDAAGAGIAGSSDMKCKIKRDADDFFYDFDDSTFKAGAHTTLQATMAEPDAIIMPGEYETEIDVSAWDDGVYTGYVEYEGSPPWAGSGEVAIYDGAEASVDINVIISESTTNTNNIITQVNNNETKIDTAITNINTVITNISNLNDLDLSTIVTGIMAEAVDGTIDVQEALTLILAALSIKSSTLIAGLGTYNRQDGTAKLTQVITPAAITGTVIP